MYESDESGKENKVDGQGHNSNDPGYKSSMEESSVFSQSSRGRTKSKPYRSLSKRQRRSVKLAKRPC